MLFIERFVASSAFRCCGCRRRTWCTKRSSSPSSGVMKPNPLEELNHFTVPFWRSGGEDAVSCSPILLQLVLAMIG